MIEPNPHHIVPFGAEGLVLILTVRSKENWSPVHDPPGTYTTSTRMTSWSYGLTQMHARTTDYAIFDPSTLDLTPYLP